MIDFEQGAIMAFAEEFPGIVVKGCHFHFTQSIWNKIQEIGLVTVYKEDKVFRTWLQKFKSLVFVPIDLVQKAFNFLVSLQAVSHHVDNLIYFIFIFVQHGNMVRDLHRSYGITMKPSGINPITMLKGITLN